MGALTISIIVHFEEDPLTPKCQKVRVLSDHYLDIVFNPQVGKLGIGFIRSDVVLYLHLLESLNQGVSHLRGNVY